MEATANSIRTLVLDGDIVPALAVARSLVRQHQQVDVASAAQAPIASYSRGVRGCFRYPDPLSQAEQFVSWLEEHLAAQHYDLIIPVSERTLVPLSRQRQRFANVIIAMADERSLEQVLDKNKTFALAQRLGVAIPKTHYLANINLLDQIKDELSYPVVVKPSHSVAGGATGFSKRNVSYASSETVLRAQCERCLEHSPAVLQGYFKGLGVGLELIAQQGKILYAFQHLRLHEVPLTGGGSSFRVSTEIEPVLLEAAAKLIRALQWHGVAMVEFKWNPSSAEYCLMEINGRFWGSLPLALAAGADFPAMLSDLLLQGRLGDYPAYRRGVYCRNLSSDMMWHEMVLRARLSGKGSSPNVNKLQIPTLSRMFRDLARVFSPRHHFDTQSLRDPVPGMVEIKCLARSYAIRLREVVTAKRFARRQRRLWRNGTVRQKVRTARTVLFICYGNINRSAAAEILMKTMLPVECATQVQSCGFHREQARPADERMQRIARENGFDLSCCSSTCLSDALINDSDVIFVMEKKHYDDLVCRSPALADKIFLLGAGALTPDKNSVEIPDPYNQSDDVYRACFSQIHQAVSRLIEALGVSHAR